MPWCLYKQEILLHGMIIEHSGNTRSISVSQISCRGILGFDTVQSCGRTSVFYFTLKTRAARPSETLLSYRNPEPHL